jgi:hypothetical protein
MRPGRLLASNPAMRLGETVACAVFAPLPQLAHRVAGTDQRAGARQKRHLIHGFGQEIVGPRLKPGHLGGAIAECGDQKDGCVGVSGSAFSLRQTSSPTYRASARQE